MLANLSNEMDFQAKALLIRADRQRIIASNIANIDTPGYSGKDINFKEAMSAALGASTMTLQPLQAIPANADGAGNSQHIPLQSTLSTLAEEGASNAQFTVQSQPSVDGNSVDIDRERASFVDNSVRYEATLRFIGNYAKTMMSAIQGQ